MALKDNPTAAYIGDGVYAYVQEGGYQIWLHANNLDHPTDRIALDTDTATALINYINRMRKEGKVMV